MKTFTLIFIFMILASVLANCKPKPHEKPLEEEVVPFDGEYELPVFDDDAPEVVYDGELPEMPVYEDEEMPVYDGEELIYYDDHEEPVRPIGSAEPEICEIPDGEIILATPPKE
jgi:hypothetical protein